MSVIDEAKDFKKDIDDLMSNSWEDFKNTTAYRIASKCIEYDQALREALSEIEKTIAWLRITEDRAHNEVADVMSITLDKYKHLLKGE